MLIKTFLNQYKTMTTNEEIKVALRKCTAPELCQLALDADLRVMNAMMDVLADFIENGAIIAERKKCMQERRGIN